MGNYKLSITHYKLITNYPLSITHYKLNKLPGIEPNRCSAFAVIRTVNDVYQLKKADKMMPFRFC